MVEYPVNFDAEAESSSEEKGWKVSTAEGLEREMATPEEFGGDNENPSPESLFTASLTSCILATFKVTAQRKDLEYGRVKVDGTAKLERGEKEGRPFMKEAELEITVTEVSDDELAEEVAEITDRNCFIKNSIQTDVQTDFKF